MSEMSNCEFKELSFNYIHQVISECVTWCPVDNLVSISCSGKSSQVELHVTWRITDGEYVLLFNKTVNSFDELIKSKDHISQTLLQKVEEVFYGTDKESKH